MCMGAPKPKPPQPMAVEQPLDAAELAGRTAEERRKRALSGLSSHYLTSGGAGGLSGEASTGKAKFGI